jgi:hypothetical protein
MAERKNPAGRGGASGGDVHAAKLNSPEGTNTSPKYQAATAPKSWRDVLPVHPAAEMFEPLSADEFKDLVDDIKRHGIRTPIGIWSGADDCEFLIDGRSRLDAAAEAGLLDVDEYGRLCLRTVDGLREIRKTRYRDHPGQLYPTDPYELAVSLNIHRRHLTAEQRIKVAEKLAKANPTMSARRVAKLANISPTTAIKAKTKVQETGDVSTVDTSISIDTKGRKQPAKKKCGKSQGPPEPKPGAVGSIFDELFGLGSKPDDAEMSAEARKAAYAEDEHRQPEREPVVVAAPDESNVASPEEIRKNILDSVERQIALVRSYKKILRVSSLDQAMKDEVSAALGILITNAQSLQRALRKGAP